MSCAAGDLAMDRAGPACTNALLAGLDVPSSGTLYCSMTWELRCTHMGHSVNPFDWRAVVFTSGLMDLDNTV